MFITTAYALTTSGNETSMTGGVLAEMLPIALILLVFYMFVFRPMDQQKKAQANLLTGLKKGDEIVTTGGVIGKIVKIDDTEVVFEPSEGMRVRILRSAIAGLYGASLPEPAPKAAKGK